MTEQLLVKGEMNIINVGWGGGSKTLYSKATSNIRVVAREIVYLLNRLKVGQHEKNALSCLDVITCCNTNAVCHNSHEICGNHINIWLTSHLYWPLIQRKYSTAIAGLDFACGKRQLLCLKCYILGDNFHI